jgi:hypothetical protein
MLANRLTMLHDPHPDNGLEMNFEKHPGRIVRTRRNPASQTIIRSLSQCSSEAWSDAFGASLPASRFPDK